MSQLALRERPREASLPGGLRSAEAKLVYLYLGQTGPTNIAELATDLRLSQLSVLPIVARLVELDLVRRDGEALRLTD